MAFFCTGILLLLSLSLTRVLYRRIFFNPLVPFFGIWFLSFFLYELDRIYRVFFVRLSEKAELLFVASFCCVFAGAVSVAIFRLRRAPRAQTPPQGFPTAQLDWLLRLTKGALLLYFAGIAWKYALLIQRFGNPFAHLSVIREATVSGEFVFPFVSDGLTILSYACIANLGFLLVAHPRRRTIVLLTALTLMGTYLRDSTVGGRGSTMINGLLLICGVFSGAMATGVKIRLKHYLAGVGALVGVILIITTILYLRSDMTRSFFERFTLDTYLYVVGTIPSFSVFVEQPWVSNFPLFQTLSGIYKLADLASQKALGVALLSAQDLQTSYARITTGPFNASGHLTYYYADAGSIGVVAISFAIGAIGAFLFFRALRGRRILDAQLYSLAMVYLIFSIRGVMTAGPSFWLTIGVLCLQHLTIQYAVNRGAVRAMEPVAG